MSKERQDVRNATKMAETTSHQVTQISAKGHNKEDERGRYLWDEAKEGKKEVSAYSTRLLCESPTSRPTLRPKERVGNSTKGKLGIRQTRRTGMMLVLPRGMKVWCREEKR